MPGRKVAELTIVAKGRDKGKRFLLTELPAAQAEEWAIRAFCAFIKSGVEIPDDIAKSGLAGIAAMGARSLGMLPYEELRPLLDTMMTCVKFMPDGRADLARPLVEDDIEDVRTRFKLRTDVFNLHTADLFDAAP